MKSLDEIFQSETNSTNALGIDREALYNEALITEKDGVKPHRASLSVVQRGENIELAHAGSVIMIQGGPKAGKSAVTSIFNTAWLRRSFGSLQADIGENRCAAILHSDEVRYGLWNQDMRISRWAGNENSLHPELRVFSLRTLDILEKRIILEELLAKEKVGLLTIDLVWDWIPSVNDEAASKELTDYLIRLSEKHQFILIVVTHESRQSRLAKGHQGAHLTAKSQTVLSIVKRGGRFIINPEHCRGKEFDRIAFQYDGENVTFLDASELSTNVSQRSIDFSLTDDDTHLNILREIFSEQPKWDTPELRARLQEDYTKTVSRIGINTVKHLLGYYRHKGWLYTEKRKYHFRNGVEHA